MTNVFKTGNSIRVVGHNGRIGRQVHGGDAERTGPIFGNRFFPHAVAGFGADGWAEVRMGLLDGKLAPFRDVGAKPFFDFNGFFLKVVVSGGDNDAFFRVEREACKVLGLVEDWLDHFEQFVAGQRGTYVVGAPADCEVAVFAVFIDKVVLQGFEKPKERVRCDNKTQPSRGAALHYTRNNAV